jgi:hypothetical protein
VFLARFSRRLSLSSSSFKVKKNFCNFFFGFGNSGKGSFCFFFNLMQTVVFVQLLRASTGGKWTTGSMVAE